MRTFKYTLLIPLRDNDGRRVSQKILDQIMDDIFNLADGWTDVGEVTGAYRMKDGFQQIDVHRCVWVFVPRKKVQALTRLVGRIGATLGQEFMYLERADGQVQLVPPRMERKDNEDGN